MTSLTASLARSRATLIALSSAIGLLVGVRSMAAADFSALRPLLTMDLLPREMLGLSWSSAAVWPADLQALGLSRLITALVSLALAAALVAVLNALVLIVEGATSRKGELSVRSALGATPFTLVRALLSEMRPLLAVSLGLGLLMGLAGGGMLRITWPDSAEPLSGSVPADLAILLSVVLCVAVLAHLSGAWQTTRSGRMSEWLRAGARAGDDLAAAFTRRCLSVIHIAVAAAVAISAVALARPFDPIASGITIADTVFVEVSAENPVVWEETLETIGAITGLESESVAGPGALAGLGVRDMTIAQCGNCSRGGMPMPLWSALADHHVVAPGFFALTGIELVEGRLLAPEDDADGARVIVINQTFARSSFEKGQPLGKQVRIGSGFDDWYTVVGVVEDHKPPVMGDDGLAREAVYLSALQHPLQDATMLLQGSEAAILAAHDALQARGLAESPPMTSEEYWATQARLQRWAFYLALLLGMIATGLAIHGIYETALQTTRRSARELAIRRAVGASPSRVLRHVLGERLRIAAWGTAGFAFLGTLAAAVLEMAGVSPPSLSAFVTTALAMSAISLAASWRAAQEAGAVEPTELLD